MINNFSIGSFIDFKLWTEAKQLLDFQISQIDKNRHYNTFSLFYYKNLKNAETKQCGKQDYFDSKIANNLFFALEKEFFTYKIAKPKDGLGLRNYNIFSYPMMILYYSVGLYLLKISQEWIDRTKSNYSDIQSFYGGDLKFKGDDLQFKNKIYYAEYYKQFRNSLREDVEEILKEQSAQEKSIVLKLDIQNYFDNITVDNLLKSIYKKIKPGVRRKFKFREEIIEQIIVFFDFIMYGKKGIPQSDNNIISGFLGYLYLLFCDLTINDIINDYHNSLVQYKIFRYVDDIYIVLKFKKDINNATKKISISQQIASEIADKMYHHFQLRLNQKTGLYDLEHSKHQELLLKEIKRTSPEYPIANEDKTQSPQDKFDAIITELKKIKQYNKYISCQPIESIQKEILKDVYDEGVKNIFKKLEKKKNLASVLQNLNFELVKVSPKELIIILMQDSESETKFIEFLKKKTKFNIRDINVTLEYLCQIKFSDKKLFDTLSQTEYFSELYDICKNKTIYIKEPGYYKLSGKQVQKIATQHNIIEQITLRLINERKACYSVALSHLLNEIHAICWFLDEPDRKEYKAENAHKYLIRKKIPHHICDSIANLFDRRNRNIVSHPSNNHYLAWEVTIQEYQQYKDCVAKSVMAILD
ncbi:MAG: AbiA family abortive infection protein [Xenococcaceae cyanobacterium MO_167.B27]|nr:AbiA family abortive infection protein [Xenococcaceae cyanobacterium MO_167.B27]